MSDEISLVFKKQITLTDAQIKVLPTTPLEIVPAHGAGSIININSLTYYFKVVQPYTLSNGDPFDTSDIVTTWGANEYNASQPVLANIFNAPCDQLDFKGGTCNASNLLIYAVDRNVCDNKSICIASDSENGLNYIGGDAGNSMTVVVSYEVIYL